MAENLGQIDVVIQSDNQTLNTGNVDRAAIDRMEAAGKLNAFQAMNARQDLKEGIPFGPDSGMGGEGGIASAPMGKMGKFATGLGVATVAVLAVKKAFDTVVNAIKKFFATMQRWDSETQQLISQLAALSGQAAMASAITAIGDFNRQMEKAKALGPMLLEMTRAREGFANVKNALDTAFGAIKITVLEVFFKTIEKLIQPLVDAFGGVDGLANAARLCTIAVLQLASDFIWAGGWLVKIISMVPGVGGPALGMVGDIGITISKKIDEAIAEVKRGNDEEGLRNDIAQLQDANGNMMAMLEHMTSGMWRHNTQVRGALASGRELNQSGFNRLSRRDRDNWGK